MRHTVFLLLIFSCLGLRAQQGLIVTTGGDSILIEYSKIRLVQAPTRAAAATILYDLSYIRFNITASFGAFTAAADCNLFSFQDPTGKWFAVPISSIDQVKKKTGADNGYIFSEIEGARQDVVYEFQDDFWEVRDTLVACAQALSGSFPGVATEMSVTGNGTAGGPIKFVNDEDVPGTDKYYGTDTSGVKGWYNLPVGGGGGGWWLTEDGDTMHVAPGEYVNMRDSGQVVILFDTITGEMTFYVAPLAGTINTMTYWNSSSTIASTAITYSSTQWNASALTGSLRLATGTTAERPGTPVIGDVRLNTTLGDLEFYNGTVWRSLAESMNGTGTPFELAIYNTAGALTDTSFTALLSGANGVTGTGVAGRVAYWSGTNTLTSNANFLWNGISLSAGTTNATYALEVGTAAARFAPASAPTGAAGVLNYLTSDWFQGHNGTSWFYLARSDDTDPGAERVWFQNTGNTAQTTSSNLLFRMSDNDGLVIGGSDAGANGLNVRRIGSAGNVASFESSTGTDLINIENTGMINFEQGISTGVGLQWGTSGQDLVGASGAGLRMNFSSSGGNKGILFNVSGLGDVVCIGGNQIGNTPTDVGVAAYAVFAPDGGGTALTVRGADSNGSNPGTAPLILRGGNANATLESAGLLQMYNGKLGTNISGGYGGVPGINTFYVYPDTPSVTNIPYKLLEWGGATTRPGLRFLNRMGVLAGYTVTEELVMHADTIRPSIKAFGEMYIDDASVQTLTFAGGSTTPAQEDGWSSGDLQAFTRTNGRLTYTGTETRKFLINVGVSFSFSEGSTDIEGWVYKNGSEVTGSGFQRRIGTGGDVGNFGSTCIVELATNDYLEIFFAPSAHTGDDDLIIEHANVTAIKL